MVTEGTVKERAINARYYTTIIYSSIKYTWSHNIKHTRESIIESTYSSTVYSDAKVDEVSSGEEDCKE